MGEAGLLALEDFDEELDEARRELSAGDPSQLGDRLRARDGDPVGVGPVITSYTSATEMICARTGISSPFRPWGYPSPSGRS